MEWLFLILLVLIVLLLLVIAVAVAENSETAQTVAAAWVCVVFGAQYPAHTFPCQRFTPTLAGDRA